MAKNNFDANKYSDLEKLPAVNKCSSRDEWEKLCWNKILKSEKFLRLLATKTERHNLVMRAAALDGLASGKSYRKIGEELWLSPQTISSISKAIDENIYRSYFERSKKERKKRQYGSRFNTAKPTKSRPEGRAHKTKYGTIYSKYF